MQKNTERGKADEQIEKFIEDNWLLLLIIGGIAALYYFRDKLLNYVLTFWESWQQEIIISFLVLAVLLIIRSVFVWWHMKNHYVYTTALPHIDRKSTRLNSSHVSISYAVFCLKK